MSANAGHYHEAADRGHTVEVMIDKLLEGHPAVEAQADLKVKLRNLQHAAAEFYQEAGKHLGVGGSTVVL